MSRELSEKTCKPCENGTPPLKGEDLEGLSAKLDESWKVVEEQSKDANFNIKQSSVFKHHNVLRRTPLWSCGGYFNDIAAASPLTVSALSSGELITV